jgi:hypothetical protein
VLVYSFCFFSHSYLVNHFWTKAQFDKRIDSFVYLVLMVVV